MQRAAERPAPVPAVNKCACGNDLLAYTKRCEACHAAHLSLENIVARARVRARDKGLDFNLVASDVVVPAVCPVLGIPLRVNVGTNGPNSPSIDRIVPHKGYVRGNVRIISHRANSLKSNASSAELELVVADLKALGQ